MLAVVAQGEAPVDIQFLDSKFKFQREAEGLKVHFDCPADKWCAMIVSEDVQPEVFMYGDTYVLARHGVCTKDCCEGLRNNDFPDHSCPHPKCCGNEGPIGIRAYHDVMGEGWSWGKNRGVGLVGGLRGDASYTAVDPDAEDFVNALILDGRNLANLSLPFNTGTPQKGFYDLDDRFRAIMFAQASKGAMTFDGGQTNLDIGYHGAGAFTACLINGTHNCGCGLPLGCGPTCRRWEESDMRKAKAACRPFGAPGGPSAADTSAASSRRAAGGVPGFLGMKIGMIPFLCMAALFSPHQI